jgi:isopenicillin-N epimerase
MSDQFTEMVESRDPLRDALVPDTGEVKLKKSSCRPPPKYLLVIVAMVVFLLSLTIGLVMRKRQNDTGITYGHTVKDKYFMMDPKLVNFNQGSYGVIAKPVFEAQTKRLTEIEWNPEAWFRFYLEPNPDAGSTHHCGATFQCALKEARAVLAQYIGARALDIVFVENASHGINAVLRSVPLFLKRKKILSLDIAYGMVKETLGYIAGRAAGAANGTLHEELVEVSTASLFADEAARESLSDDAIVTLVSAALDANEGEIALAAFSHIASIPAIVLPVKRLTQLCHEKGVRVLIDGAHVPGHMTLNVTDIGADFYVGNGHKWLYTTRGCAFLHVSQEAQNFVYPPVIDFTPDWETRMQSQFGWQGTTDYTNYLSLVDAVAFRASLPGGDAGVIEYIHNLAVQGGQMLVDNWGTEMLPADMTAALVNVRLPCEPPTGGAERQGGQLEPQGTRNRQADDAQLGKGCTCPDNLIQQLYQQHHTFVPMYSLAGGSWIRISAQIYHDISDFQILRDGVQALVQAHCQR